jgi:RNA binding exosome subunit
LNRAKAISARLSSFAHATEDIDRVIRAMRNICPQEPQRRVRTEKMRGHYGNQITACLLTFSGRPEAERFFNHLWNNLSSIDKTTLYSEAESHIDESGILHIRLDKQKALKGIIALNDEQPVKIEVSFARWERSLSVADQLKTRLREPWKGPNRFDFREPG